MKCEEALMMKMAELDGEGVASTDAVKHIESCDNCRHEIAAMQGLDAIFRQHTAATSDVNVWPIVETRIAGTKTRVGWQALTVLVVAMAVIKIIEMSLDKDPGWLFGLVPLAVAVVLFILLRENPFKVNTELILESNHG